MRVSHGWLGILLMVSLATAAWADDLALVRITNQSHVETATRLFGHAYARSGSQYLVAVNPLVADSLTANGLSYETVMRDVSVRTACVVLSNQRGKQAGLDVTTLGEGVPLENGVYLMARPSAAAADARDRGVAFVLPLADRKVGFHYQATAAERPFAPTDVFPTDTLANKVNLDSMRIMNQRLEAFRTRYIYTDSCIAAKNWIVSKFASWGYSQISTPSYYYNGRTIYNVQVIKPGYAEPDKIVVIGGHYDTWNGQGDPMVFAPGSDDDGSGTALTMEIARVLASVPLRKTVIFIPFTAEEEGLIGSYYAAWDFKNQGAKIEAMLNYDMIGYTIDSYWDLSLSSGPNPAYMNLCIQAANRVSTLYPKVVGMGSSSDHYSFFEQGYDIVDNIESDFNNQGWHTNTDLTSLMNFPYMNQVVRMAAASLAQIANSGSPVSVTQVLDAGNGSDLQVTVSGCLPGSQNWLYWATNQALTNPDSVLMPSGQCTYLVQGLTPGVRWYFGAFTKPADGYRSVWSGIGSEIPMVNPRAPQNLVADPAERKILLDWNDNNELDLAYYRVYRHLEGVSLFDLQASGLLTSSYVDSQVVPGLKYFYRVTAMDNTGHESEVSNIVSTYPATFDGGILVVDEFTQDYEYFADEAHQAAYFDTLLGFMGHTTTRVDSPENRLDKGTAGRFSSIFWDDDDFLNKQLGQNASVIDWYLTHPVNMMICGIKTIQGWSTTPVNSGHTLYKEFMVSAYYLDNFEIFSGGIGANGWPNAVWGTTRGWPHASDIPVLTVRPGGTVIMTYDAIDDDVKFEGKPCGVAYSGPNGKRVIFSFPLYYLTPASATAIMAKVKEFFGESGTTIPPGDIDHSGLADPADLSTLVAYLTGGMPQLPDRNAADVNHSCFVDVTDLATLVSYLTGGVSALQPGCVTP